MSSLTGTFRLSATALLADLTGTIARTLMTQETGLYQLPLEAFRVWDAMQTNLPGTAATDDLAVVTGTLGTNAPMIQSSDAKNTTVTQYARLLMRLPPEYVSAQSVSLRLHAGMVTTVANGTATIDAQVYALDGDAAVGADLCTTAATSINSLTFADKDFSITATSLEPGSVLDIRLAIAITDSATGTAVIGALDLGPNTGLRIAIKG